MVRLRLEGRAAGEHDLRALHFAMCRRDCEDARQTAEQRERIMASRGSSSLVG